MPMLFIILTNCDDLRYFLVLPFALHKIIYIIYIGLKLDIVNQYNNTG